MTGENLRLDFADGPRLDLERQLERLIRSANDVIGTQARLRTLIRANELIVSSDYELNALLHRIVEVAAQLVGARYAAIGVFGTDGQLDNFVHTGMDEDTVAQIGRYPCGQGILRALSNQERPIRSTDVASDPRSSGFPPGHPIMHSFLGVPIRVRDTIYGNLYLTESDAGEFSDEDEQLIAALSVTAGIAIENTRLLADSRRREKTWEAAAEITQQLLSDSSTNAGLNLLAQRVRELTDADIVAVILPSHTPDTLTVKCASGLDADALTGRELPDHGTMAAQVIADGQSRLLTDNSPDSMLAIAWSEPLGPAMVVPLIAEDSIRGVLTVARRAGCLPFHADDSAIMDSFAGQAAIALERAEARTAQEHMRVLQDRERIARDLHDHVIQRLFASGLSLQSIADNIDSGPHADRLHTQVGELDATIGQIRNTIFGLRSDAGSGLRRQVMDICEEMSRVLPNPPQLRFQGPVETMTDPTTASDVVAVVREGMSNTVRHAKAEHTMVTLSVVDEMLRVDICDDGIGVMEDVALSGLHNLAARAEKLGGHLHLQNREPRGTRLTWVIPLPAESS